MGKILFSNAGGKTLTVEGGTQLVLNKVEKQLVITASGKQGPPGPVWGEADFDFGTF